MNNTFSFKRFRLLVRQQGTENFKVYTILWAVIALSILFIAMLSDSPDISGLYLLLFCLGGCIIATTSFSRWTNFGRSSFFLLIPATMTEKFLCNLFYSLVLYIPLYLFTYFFTRYILLSVIVVFFFHPGVPLSEMISAGLNDVIFIAFPFWIVFALMSLMSVQTIFIITAIWLKRWHFLIALLIIMGIWIIYIFCTGDLMSSLTHISNINIKSPGIVPYLNSEFSYYISSGNKIHGEYFHLIKLIRNLNNLIWFIIFGLLYISAWFKLKEREI